MDPAAIDPELVDDELNKNGYLVLKERALAATAEAARAEYNHCLQHSKAHAPKERFHYGILRSEPWRKLTIGSANGLGNPYAQNLQTIYFSADDENYPALSALFKFMIAVRNRLMRVDAAFGSTPERDGFWDACRVHHYPRGGGFMVMHKDTHFPAVIRSQIGKPFYQVSVLLSRKQVDFSDGGGFVISNHDKKIDLETEGGFGSLLIFFGSLLIFDGRTYHGVDDVDLDHVIDFSRPDGRLAAFVNLYSVS